MNQHITLIGAVVPELRPLLVARLLHVFWRVAPCALPLR